MRKDIQDKFHQIISKQISLSDFEQWVYQTSELESLLPSEDYLTLISFDYKSQNWLYEIEKVVSKYIAFHEYEGAFVSNVLRSIINKDANSFASIVKTYDLYCSGYDFLRRLALLYGLCLDTPDCSELTYEKMYPDIVRDAKNALSWFENDKIIFTPESNDMGGYEYIDKRSKTEFIQGEPF